MYKGFRLRFPIVLVGCVSLFLMGAPLGIPHHHHAAAAPAGTVVGPSGLPLPRFVSLKPSRVNLRVGPGRQYAVSWLFQKSGLPVEIIQEYDNWRRIRDADGTEGWVYQSLLSGRRTAITAPWKKDDPKAMLELYRSPGETSGIVAHVEPGVIGALDECNGEWCRLEIKGIRGWMKQSELWGAYPGEKFD
ncbi:SH3 domain-containing protein [Phyllobacterium phragmitis]